VELFELVAEARMNSTERCKDAIIDQIKVDEELL
jgi:hypothetical protein